MRAAFRVWEVFRGLNPNDRTDASADADGDGQALAGFRTGTDLRDRQSALKIGAIQFYRYGGDRGMWSC